MSYKSFGLVLLGLLFVSAPSALAASPCDTVGTPFLTITRNVSNDPDSGNHGDWATDAFTENISVWLGSDNQTYCANATVSDATFVTTGPLSPENGNPLAAGIAGTFTGGETYILPSSLVLAPAYSATSTQAVVLPDTSTEGFSAWVHYIFPAVDVTSGSTYVNTYSLTYVTAHSGTWTDAGTGDAGDIGSIINSTTGVTYPTIQDAVNAAADGDIVALGSDATTSSQITVNKAITIDGNGHTLYAPFAKTDNLNNSAIGITHSGVAIKNLIEDGTGSSGYRHGINIFEATSSVSLDNVTVKNNAASGVTINGSTVSINNITTSHNSWGGINADQAADAPDPTSVTITGTSSHDEMPAMWVDDVTKDVAVMDVAHQYSTQAYVHGSAITGTLYGLNSAVVSNEAALRAALANTFVSTITMSADIVLAAELDITRSVTIDGAGHTMGASFSGASVLQIQANDVTIKNLVEDGNGTTGHNRGINIYKATGSLLDTVTASNNYKYGIVVNGSTVTVKNIVTKDNGWGGIDVDMGGNVTTLASLTVNGTSVHDETNADIRIDDTSKIPTPTVIDTNDQYMASTTATGIDYYLKTKNTKTATVSHETSTDSSIAVTVDIPADTIIKGGSSWDGSIAPPTAKVVSVTVSGFTTNVTSAIAVGSSDTDLTFDKAAKLTFAGQAGKLVGWYNHAGEFAEITAACGSNDQATGDALASGTACKIDAGSDLVVWTKHFSTFATYTQTPIVFGSSSVAASSGGSGGGSSGGGGSIAATSAAAATPTATPATPAAPATPAQGKVLGAATYNFTKDLHMGSTGTDVTELQKLLIASGFDIPAITKGGMAYGTFGGQTLSAVIAYQKAHGLSPARGYVSTLTRAELNKGTATSTATTTPTGKTNLTASQANAIITMVQAFGADASTVAQVKAALGQ